jgi:hypothetical protein
MAAIAGAVGGAMLLLAAAILTVLRRRRITDTMEEQRGGAKNPVTEGGWKSRGSGPTDEHVVGASGGGKQQGGGQGGGSAGARSDTIGDKDMEDVHEAVDEDMAHDSAPPNGRSDSVVEHKDENGRVYYYNKYTAKTGWTADEVSRVEGVERLQGPRKPQGGNGGVRGPTESVVEVVDDSTGKAYYYNKHTNATSWSADGASRGTANAEYGLEGDAKGGEGAMDMNNPMFGHRTLASHSSKLRMT